MLSRRDFLTRSIITAGGTLLSADAVFAAMARDPAGSVPVSGGPMLYLNNDLIPVGQIINVQQMSNAAPASNTSTVRSALVPQLRTASPIAGQIQLQMNWLNSKALADWISAAVAHAPTASSGTLLVISDDFQVHSSYTWSGGMITQYVLPACDATVTAAAYPTLSFQAGAMTSSLATTPPPTANRRLALQRWQVNHFKVTSNVELQLVHTAQVGAIVLNPGVRGGSVSFAVEYETVRSGEMQPWTNATANPGGQPVPGQSTEITVTYLGLDMQSPIGSVTLHDCRVLNLSNQIISARVSRLTATVSFADATVGLTAV